MDILNCSVNFSCAIKIDTKGSVIHHLPQLLLFKLSTLCLMSCSSLRCNSVLLANWLILILFTAIYKACIVNSVSKIRLPIIGGGGIES